MTSTTRIDEAADAITRRWPQRPSVGIVLGTGLGNFADEIRAATTIDFTDIPHFSATTALGHSGQLVCGQVAGVSVVAMSGRHHLYEGHTWTDIAMPIRILKRLGIEKLILSNASGGVHPRLQQGDIMVIEDHINLLGRFRAPDGSAHEPPPHRSGRPYDRQLIQQACQVARRLNLNLPQGVYAAMTGPNYETRAEYRFLRTIGADVVGMSTVPEVQEAQRLNLPVLAFSAVTNVCQPDRLLPTDGHAVMAAAQSTEPRLRDIVTNLLSESAP